MWIGRKIPSSSQRVSIRSPPSILSMIVEYFDMWSKFMKVMWRVSPVIAQKLMVWKFSRYVAKFDKMRGAA